MLVVKRGTSWRKLPGQCIWRRLKRVRYSLGSHTERIWRQSGYGARSSKGVQLQLDVTFWWKLGLVSSYFAKVLASLAPLSHLGIWAVRTWLGRGCSSKLMSVMGVGMCLSSYIDRAFKGRGFMPDKILLVLSAHLLLTPRVLSGVLQTSVRSRMVLLVVRRGSRQTHASIVEPLVLRPV